MKLLTLDLETSPNVADVWGLWGVNISLSQLRESQRVLCFGARWYGSSKTLFYSEWQHGREGMLQAAWELLNEADAQIGYNTAGYDSKHLNAEWARVGMSRPSPYREIDLLKVVKKHFAFPSKKLDYVAGQLLGEHKVTHTGHSLWTGVLSGDPKALRLMTRYCKGDVELTERLYEKFRDNGWLDKHAHFVCAHKRTQKRGKVLGAGGQIYQQVHCLDCRGWFREPANLAGGLNPLRRIAS